MHLDIILHPDRLFLAPCIQTITMFYFIILLLILFADERHFNYKVIIELQCK